MEESLIEYLAQHKVVLVRGIDIYPGLSYLKDKAPESQLFTSNDEGVCQMLNHLDYPLASEGIYVAHGDGSDISELKEMYQRIWYFKDVGPKGQGRYLGRNFELVISFADGKLSGLSKYVFSQEV